MKTDNKSLHWIFIPLHSVNTSEFNVMRKTANKFEGIEWTFQLLKIYS